MKRIEPEPNILSELAACTREFRSTDCHEEPEMRRDAQRIMRAPPRPGSKPDVNVVVELDVNLDCDGNGDLAASSLTLARHRSLQRLFRPELRHHRVQHLRLELKQYQSVSD
jgi:hypothetical protein